MALKIFTLAIFIIISFSGAGHFSPLYADEAIAKGKFFGAKDTEFPPWFKESFLDLKEDIHEASADNKRLMLFFHQAGCPYCNALVERNLSQKDIEKKVRKNIDVIAINMWGDKEITHVDGNNYTEKSFAEALKIQFTPTLIFFNEAGEIILRLNGYRSPQRFKLDLDYVILQKETVSSYRDFINANRPAVETTKTLIKEDFFNGLPYDLSQRNSKPFAVFFEQKDCPNCDYLHNKVLVEPRLRQLIKQFDAMQLDMWSRTPVVTPQGKQMTAREWAKALDIKFAPSIVLFNPEGKEIIRTEAFFKLFHNMGVFNYVLSGAYRQHPSFQRYLSEFAEDLQEQGQDVDIWSDSEKNPVKQ